MTVFLLLSTPESDPADAVGNTAGPPRCPVDLLGPIIVRDVFQLTREKVPSTIFVVPTRLTPSQQRTQLAGHLDGSWTMGSDRWAADTVRCAAGATAGFRRLDRWPEQAVRAQRSIQV